MCTVFANVVEINEMRALYRSGLNHLVAMSAVVMSADGQSHYVTAMEKLRSHCGIPHGCELTWSAPADSWLHTSPGLSVRRQVWRGMLHAAAESGARTISVIYDRQPGEPAGIVRTRVLGYLYDKVALHLLRRNEQGGMIAGVAGSVDERQAWKVSTKELAEHGTAYTPVEKMSIPIVDGASDGGELCQLADLVTGATTALVAGNPPAMDLATELEGLADRNRAGGIGGTGVTLWPPRHTDLYWWLYREDVYQRRTKRLHLGSAAKPMPWRTFQNNAGM